MPGIVSFITVLCEYPWKYATSCAGKTDVGQRNKSTRMEYDLRLYSSYAYSRCMRCKRLLQALINFCVCTSARPLHVCGNSDECGVYFSLLLLPFQLLIKVAREGSEQLRKLKSHNVRSIVPVPLSAGTHCNAEWGVQYRSTVKRVLKQKTEVWRIQRRTIRSSANYPNHTLRAPDFHYSLPKVVGK